MHLSTIYNLISQRDQATNLAIAAATREIALQSKVDQANSLEIAQASRKIAEDSRKDSNAMKLIAIVTMVYLPGTFVATCFSMGLFQWNAKSPGVVNPRIWIYVLFRTLLTALTIGCFATWTWWRDRKSLRANLKAQDPSSIMTTDGINNNSQRPLPVVHATDTSRLPASLQGPAVTVPSSPLGPQSELIEPPEKETTNSFTPAGVEQKRDKETLKKSAGTARPGTLEVRATGMQTFRSVSPFRGDVSPTASGGHGLLNASAEQRAN
ncbi:hypothetical protein LTR70_005082 [Exophiala xenobiotica]|uniref:Uncharacterized protein n=1 Tax=Lithohypha guttulata TaxID=1690604 RepID=A0ABR0K970_9EURO|nr:hypothetical protein LTR24_005558 [Lithohypha guttulata]KAK5319329.1 hypothetical protein LTR70_005082 [Exophiala xenobiotica]